MKFGHNFKWNITNLRDSLQMNDLEPAGLTAEVTVAEEPSVVQERVVSVGHKVTSAGAGAHQQVGVLTVVLKLSLVYVDIVRPRHCLKLFFCKNDGLRTL